MFNFLKKNKEEIENPLIKITALLIHAAKIDENYTKKEKQIIKKAIVELSSKNEKIDEILLKAEELERESNQILNFTREDFPDPDNPVITTNLSRGMETFIFFKLFSFAPLI